MCVSVQERRNEKSYKRAGRRPVVHQFKLKFTPEHTSDPLHFHLSDDDSLFANSFPATTWHSLRLSHHIILLQSVSLIRELHRHLDPSSIKSGAAGQPLDQDEVPRFLRTFTDHAEYDQ